MFQYTIGGDYNTCFSWTKRKHNLVSKVKHSSMHSKIRALYLNELQDLYMDEDTYGFGCGGFPITVRNIGVVGTIVVSGLPDSLDHFYVIEALEKMLNIKTVKIPSEVDEMWF